LSVAFSDLSGADPEAVITLSTGGEHCCFIDQVYDFDLASPRKTEIDFADVGATLRTIDGRTVFVSANDGFAYKFTGFAASGEPIRIWQYEPGHFIDVTGRYPALIARNAASWWTEYEQSKKATSSVDGDVRGFLAASAADQTMLGHAAVAKQQLLKIASNGTLSQGSNAGWPTGRAYVAALWRFLAQNGYLGAAGPGATRSGNHLGGAGDVAVFHPLSVTRRLSRRGRPSQETAARSPRAAGSSTFASPMRTTAGSTAT
jgi:hypothetical protein